jgi:hypothetical protein
MRTLRRGSIVALVAVAVIMTLRSADSQGGKAPSEEAKEKHEFIAQAMTREQEALNAQVKQLEKWGINPLLLPPPEIKPFGDWDFYYLKGRLTWTPIPGQEFEPVVVPTGFVSDLASIPRLFWSKLRPKGRYAYAAIVHDYLYWTQTRTREEADRILQFAMEDPTVDRTTIFAIYQAMRLGGKATWDGNAQRKKEGEKRILKLFPPDFTTSWEEWKKRPGVFAE